MGQLSNRQGNDDASSLQTALLGSDLSLPNIDTYVKLLKAPGLPVGGGEAGQAPAVIAC